MHRATERKVSYWLGGAEDCAHCLQRYVYEEELRCVACDGAVCRHCVIVVRESRETFCPGCHGSSEED